MLSNAYFLAKFRFDIAENEPAKNLQNFAKKRFATFANFAENTLRYTQWRVLPRSLRAQVIKYLSFVWDCTDKAGETEAEMMSSLSPSLRSVVSARLRLRSTCNFVFFRRVNTCSFASLLQCSQEL